MIKCIEYCTEYYELFCIILKDLLIDKKYFVTFYIQNNDGIKCPNTLTI